MVVIAEPEQIVCEVGAAAAVLAGQPITSEYVVPLPVHPPDSVAVTTIGNVPDCVGVPLSTPADDNVSPDGSVLTVVNV